MQHVAGRNHTTQDYTKFKYTTQHCETQNIKLCRWTAVLPDIPRQFSTNVHHTAYGGGAVKCYMAGVSMVSTETDLVLVYLPDSASAKKSQSGVY